MVLVALDPVLQSEVMEVRLQFSLGSVRATWPANHGKPDSEWRRPLSSPCQVLVSTSVLLMSNIQASKALLFVPGNFQPAKGGLYPPHRASRPGCPIRYLAHWILRVDVYPVNFPFSKNLLPGRDSKLITFISFLSNKWVSSLMPWLYRDHHAIFQLVFKEKVSPYRYIFLCVHWERWVPHPLTLWSWSPSRIGINFL